MVNVLQEGSSTFQVRVLNRRGVDVWFVAADIRRVFSRRGSGEFSSRFPSIRFPRKQDLIVCVSDEARDCRKAVQELESCGFDWSVIVLHSSNRCTLFFSSVYVRGREEEESSLQSMERGASVRYLSRHAVALLLGLTDFPAPTESVVLDVRRMDELVMFGSVQGMKHLTGTLIFRTLFRSVLVNELPKALTLETEAFFEKYQFRKPGVDDVVVTSCRTCKRAVWAAELLMEAGYRKVFVHKTGTQGWRFSPSVKAYDEYDLGDVIPRPVQLPKEKPNVSEGFNELESFNLIPNGVPNSSQMSGVEADVVPNYDRTRNAYRMHEGHILEESL